MVRARLVIALSAAACGHLQFDSTGRPAADGSAATTGDAAPPDASTAPPLVFQQTTGKFRTHNGTSATSSPFSVSPTVGNRIVVLAWTFADSGTMTDAITASDSSGNTYGDAVQTSSGGTSPFVAAILTAPIGASASDLQVTVAFPDAQSQIVAVAMEYSGAGTLDQIGVASGGAGMPTVSTTGATTAAHETVFAVVNVNLPNEVYTSIAPGGSFVDRVEEDNTAFMEQAGEGAEAAVATVGVQSCTWTTAPDPTTDWDAVIATFR
ncbi:MAG TPA: hypothetical protein VMJ10_34865 [Kofleriaceae bacterium]|nr:hypothetical protein [Kofleriaceae bacterium]